MGKMCQWSKIHVLWIFLLSFPSIFPFYTVPLTAFPSLPLSPSFPSIHRLFSLILTYLGRISPGSRKCCWLRSFALVPWWQEGRGEGPKVNYACLEENGVGLTFVVIFAFFVGSVRRAKNGGFTESPRSSVVIKIVICYLCLFFSSPFLCCIAITIW